MRLDPITLKVIRHRRATIESVTLLLPHLLSIQELLSSYSELDPPLPIPNRAVKRLSADDSADYPCESRTLLGSLPKEKPSLRGLFFFLYALATWIPQRSHG